MAAVTVESGFTDDWQGERTLAECNLHMLKSADTCDMTFRVGQKEDIVRAHRYILISRSCVFYSMLCGQWSHEESIKIPDVSKEFFAEFLTFLYTDDCSLTADNVTGLLYLSKKYAVHRLQRLCLSFLQANLTPENACVVLEQAHFFDEDELFKQALTIITTNGNVSLMTSGFRDLCHSCLKKVLISNDLDFHTKPEMVFDGILSWASAECSKQGKEVTPRNQRDVLGEAVYLIGFTGFEAASFVEKVVPSELLNDSECLKLMSKIVCPNKDVGQFRTVDTTFRPNEEVVLNKIEVYNEFSIPTDTERSLFRKQYVHDALKITCDQTSQLYGMTLTPSEANYVVTVTQADNIILTTKFNSTLENVKVNFPKSIQLHQGLTYCINVKHLSRNCPLTLMTNMKEKVFSQNKSFHFSRNSNFIYIKGFIMNLTMS